MNYSHIDDALETLLGPLTKAIKLITIEEINYLLKITITTQCDQTIVVTYNEHFGMFNQGDAGDLKSKLEYCCEHMDFYSSADDLFSISLKIRVQLP